MVYFAHENSNSYFSK